MNDTGLDDIGVPAVLRRLVLGVVLNTVPSSRAARLLLLCRFGAVPGAVRSGLSAAAATLDPSSLGEEPRRRKLGVR